MEISKEKFNEVKNKAIKFFKEHKKINSPAFWKIKITSEWFNHITWKSINHKRWDNEIFVRYLCFMHIEYILSNLKLYQEYRTEIKKVEIKRWWKIIKEDRIISLYWFVAVVNWNKIE